MYFYYDKKTFQVKMIAEGNIGAKQFSYKQIIPTIEEQEKIDNGCILFIEKGKLRFENPLSVKEKELEDEKKKLKDKIKNNEKITNEDIANILTKL